MARWRPRGRPSRREEIELRNAQHRWYGLMSIKPNGPEIAERLCTPLPPKRDRIKRPVDGKPAVPLEKEVLADVLQALRNDPRIGFVWRQSSGTFREGDRYIQTGPKGMPDICGVLAGSGQAFFIEVKRPGGEPDHRQAERLAQLKRAGAVAGYCWSIESALALLP